MPHPLQNVSEPLQRKFSRKIGNKGTCNKNLSPLQYMPNLFEDFFEDLVYEIINPKIVVMIRFLEKTQSHDRKLFLDGLSYL